MKSVTLLLAIIFSINVNAQTRIPSGAFKITPYDTANLVHPAKGIYVGVTGDIKADMINGDTAVVFKAVPVGVLNIYVKKIYATGTTATNLVGLKESGGY